MGCQVSWNETPWGKWKNGTLIHPPRRGCKELCGHLDFRDATSEERIVNVRALHTSVSRQSKVLWRACLRTPVPGPSLQHRS